MRWFFDIYNTPFLVICHFEVVVFGDFIDLGCFGGL